MGEARTKLVWLAAHKATLIMTRSWDASQADRDRFVHERLGGVTKAGVTIKFVSTNAVEVEFPNAASSALMKERLQEIVNVFRDGSSLIDTDEVVRDRNNNCTY